MKHTDPDFIIRKEDFAKTSFLQSLEAEVNEKLLQIETHLRTETLAKAQQDILKQLDQAIELRQHIMRSVEQDILSIITATIDGFFSDLTKPTIISAALHKVLSTQEETGILQLYCSEKDIHELEQLVEDTDLSSRVICTIDPNFASGQAHLYAKKRCFDISCDVLIGSALEHLAAFRSGDPK